MKFALLSILLLYSLQNNFAKAQSYHAFADSLKKQMAKIKAANKKHAAKMQLQYFVIKAELGTYGYDVYADGKLYLYQNIKPATGGNLGFADTASAGATAGLSTKKVRQGETPPTITVSELKKLKIITP